ncbi:MAG: hypothetical protein ACI4TT_04580 [Christensenellales bacterium]
MKTNLTPEELCFKLFLDAVKRKDKSQFAYFSLYSNIAHCDDILIKTNTEGDELTL